VATKNPQTKDSGQVGDNRRAGDPDGNRAAGNHKSPGVKEPDKNKQSKRTT